MVTLGPVDRNSSNSLEPVLCSFQETKLRGDDLLRSAEDIAGRLGWKLSLGNAARSATGGASAGMGITVVGLHKLIGVPQHICDLTPLQTLHHRAVAVFTRCVPQPAFPIDPISYVGCPIQKEARPTNGGGEYCRT